MTDGTVTDRDEQWRNFYATQLERQTAAAETSAKKLGTIETILSVWLTLTLVGAVIVVIASLAGS